jgi:hypothetical protein
MTSNNLESLIEFSILIRLGTPALHCTPGAPGADVLLVPDFLFSDIPS